MPDVMLRCEGAAVDNSLNLDRRDFLKGAAALSGGALMAAEPHSVARPLSEKEKLDRLASNTWPIRYIFKSRMRATPTSEEMKKKYGEITMLDFPTFTKETFPGVRHMDLFSGLFGDFNDESMYLPVTAMFNGTNRTTYEFDPSSASGKRWIERMAAKMAA